MALPAADGATPLRPAIRHGSSRSPRGCDRLSSPAASASSVWRVPKRSMRVRTAFQVSCWVVAAAAPQAHDSRVLAAERSSATCTSPDEHSARRRSAHDPWVVGSSPTRPTARQPRCHSRGLGAGSSACRSREAAPASRGVRGPGRRPGPTRRRQAPRARPSRPREAVGAPTPHLGARPLTPGHGCSVDRPPLGRNRPGSPTCETPR